MVAKEGERGEYNHVVLKPCYQENRKYANYLRMPNHNFE